MSTPVYFVARPWLDLPASSTRHDRFLRAHLSATPDSEFQQLEARYFTWDDGVRQIIVEGHVRNPKTQMFVTLAIHVREPHFNGHHEFISGNVNLFAWVIESNYISDGKMNGAFYESISGHAHFKLDEQANTFKGKFAFETTTSSLGNRYHVTDGEFSVLLPRLNDGIA